MTPDDKRHLADERLIACSLVEGDSANRAAEDTAAFEHLDACRPCAARYARVASALQGVRSGDAADIDALFTDARLETQRTQIMRRLEALGRHARVLPFPAAGARPTAHRGSHRTVRWVATAAAAGLIGGVSLGWLVNVPRLLDRDQAPQIVSAPARPTPAPVAAFPAAPFPDTDEALLLQIDEALVRQPTSELAAIDAFTPRVREATVRLR